MPGLSFTPRAGAHLCPAHPELVEPQRLAPAEEPFLGDPPAHLVSLTAAELAEREELTWLQARHDIVEAALLRAHPWLTRIQLAIAAIGFAAAAWSTAPAWSGWLS